MSGVLCFMILHLARVESELQACLCRIPEKRIIHASSFLPAVLPVARRPHSLREQQPVRGARLHVPAAERLQRPGQVAVCVTRGPRAASLRSSSKSRQPSGVCLGYLVIRDSLLLSRIVFSSPSSFFLPSPCASHTHNCGTQKRVRFQDIFFVR